MRDEIQRIRNEIRDCETELRLLTREWAADRIADAEFDRRATEPRLRLDALQVQRLQRLALHDRSTESLPGDDLDALVADLIECRDAAIERKKRFRTLRSTERSEQQSEV